MHGTVKYVSVALSSRGLPSTDTTAGAAAAGVRREPGPTPARTHALKRLKYLVRCLQI